VCVCVCVCVCKFKFKFYVFYTLHVPTFRTLNNKVHKLKYNKTDHKTLFTLGTNSYVFRHQGAIFREFIKNK